MREVRNGSITPQSEVILTKVLIAATTTPRHWPQLADV